MTCNKPTDKRFILRFICTDCETEYETGEELNEHIQSVHEMKQCSVCPEIIGTKDQVDAHVLEVHGSQETLETPLGSTGEDMAPGTHFTCELCYTLIEGEEEFNQHIEVIWKYLFTDACTAKIKHYS